jgi:SAM-dependent methyltransferase
MKHDSRLTRLRDMRRTAGVTYVLLFLSRRVLDVVGAQLDRGLLAIEVRRRLVASWCVSARRFTAAENRAAWNTHDWTQGGEEWTRDIEWKAGLIRECLEPNIPPGSTVVEIGPGAGRWTAVLQRRAAKMHVIDVSERALSLCQDRFAFTGNIEYLLGDGRTIPLPGSSIDAVWSYDVFVHINPLDARSYFAEVARILKPGGRAVVHHPGFPGFASRRARWRSDLTAGMVDTFIRECGLHLVSQTTAYVNEGDVLSVIEKPCSGQTRDSLIGEMVDGPTSQADDLDAGNPSRPATNMP